MTVRYNQLMEHLTLFKRIQTMSNLAKAHFLLLASLLFIASLVHPAQALQTGDGLTLDVLVGYDSFYKGEHWVPVQVFAANNGPAVEGYIEIDVSAARLVCLPDPVSAWCFM